MGVRDAEMASIVWGLGQRMGPVEVGAGRDPCDPSAVGMLDIVYFTNRVAAIIFSGYMVIKMLPPG